MANHCEDVTCAQCGETWCARECGARYSSPGWRTYHLHKLRDRHASRSANNPPEPLALKCDACGSRQIYVN